MNELMIFDNPEFGSIRSVEIDGEAWLVGKDVAQALGYREANREKVAAYQREYREANREKLAARQREYRTRKKEEDHG